MPSIEELIGQRIVYGFHGKSVQEPEVQRLENYIERGLVGGIIIFSYNIDSSDQLKRLLGALTRKSKAVLFVAIDQEGGRVQRLRQSNGFTDYPSAFSQTQLTSEQRQQNSYLLAHELKGFGFNLNFNPVVDLYDADSTIIGQLGRAFSANPMEVAEYALDLVEGHHRAGIATCLKHFPGHGLVKGDSHQGFVDATEVAREEEYLPYQVMVEEGMADMIMTAHVFNKHVDPDWVASLSPHFLQGILRQRLGYEGVIISDDLHMGAIQKTYSTKQAVIQTFKAGSDMVILSNNPAAAGGVEGFKPDHELPEKVVTWVKEAIEAGQYSLEDLQEGYERVMALKAWLGNLNEPQKIRDEL